MIYQLSKNYKKFFLSTIIFGIILLLYKWSQFFFKKKLLYIFNDQKLWTSIYISSIYFFSISIGSLLFLSIQNISKSGWSIIIHPIMNKISSFIPYGSILILIILLINIIHPNKPIFHWMNDYLYNPKSIYYDKILMKKKLYLNIPFFLIRNLFYVLGCIFFYFRINKISYFLNVSYSLKYYNKLYSNSIYFIIFFAFISTFLSWDWIMSITPHWFSTLFGWYFLSGILINGIVFITIVSIFLKKIGVFHFFNKSHMNDLGTYIFSGSLLWSYFWFSQFLLYWYGNIPEEMLYFFKREKLYYNIHFLMLIPNFIIPLLLISRKNKCNSNRLLLISIIILIGHYIDLFNLIDPNFYNKISFGLYEISSLFIIGGSFFYILLSNLKNQTLYLTEHPFFKESKEYKNHNL
ncbi:hypothetical protein [Blattabacterium cuenoti]|uniref:hypothetical protein n=1 Tax=Blattabacterium cuenoti TaxID=1653831 RepID=UPI001EEA1E0E|nr:hypothetical protein [Blattabacterium cuenoti]